MKFLRLLILALTAGIVFSSCQKELSAETGSAIGTLAKDAAGDCSPIGVSGAYKKDTTLNATHFVDVQLDVTNVGIYIVSTDTVNGYYFRATGVTPLPGANSIRLIGFGKPIAVGTDVFTVKFGSTTCEFNVNVTLGTGGGVTTARFTFSNTGGACTSAIQTTNFYIGLPTNPTTHTITLLVDVQTAGTYNLTTTLTNGITFSGTGSLSVGNSQQIILGASGTPVVAGPVSYTFSTTTPVASSCGFDLTVQNAPAAAVYTFTCGSANFAGTYQVGTAMTASNRITVPVTVTTPGSYSITTTVNGVTFSGSNVLTATSSSIILNATGTPIGAAAPSTVFILSGGGGASCPITIPFTTGGGGGEAVFFYTCSYSIITGTFQSGLALTNSDKISIPVGVGVSGNYLITSNTVNGVTFSGSGFLTAASGIQYIDLTATGQVPINTIAQSISFDLTGTLGFNCSIIVPFTVGGVTTDYLRAKINGSTLRNFNTDLLATLSGSPGAYLLEISGDFSTFGRPSLSIDINSNTAISATTYNQTSTTSSIVSEYFDFNSNGFFGSSGSGQSGPFTVQITSITTAPNRVKGTFFGTLVGGIPSWGSVTITEGEFSIPY
jgi:hypothetical protein